jgi:hypothetical protein
VDRTSDPNMDSLMALGLHEGVDIRPTLLRVTTDLYVAKADHSEQEERQFVELALRLIDLVDAPTREAVMHKLQAYPQAPQAVLAKLTGERAQEDGGAHAAPTEPEAAPSPARRAVAHDLDALFFSATPDERRLILLGLDYSLIPPAAAPDAASASETVRNLELAALSHNAEAFARTLERTLQVDRTQAQRIMADESGEPVLVAAIALGMTEAVLQRILLCLNPTIAQSVQRVYELASLYEEIEPESALKMVAIWQAIAKAEAASDRPARTAANAPAQRRTAQSESGVRASPTPRPAIRWDEHAKRQAEGS